MFIMSTFFCPTQPATNNEQDLPDVLTPEEKNMLIIDFVLGAVIAIGAILAANGVNLGALNSVGAAGPEGAYGILSLVATVYLISVIVVHVKMRKQVSHLALQITAQSSS